jgi:hypothetical protein
MKKTWEKILESVSVIFPENVIKSVNICNMKIVFKNFGLARLYNKE